MSSTVLAKVQIVLKELFGIDPRSVSLETIAFDIPGWDSVGHLSLCGALEEAFEVRLDASEFTAIDNVRAIVSIIEAKKGLG
jgi:acyl carrier protein